MKVADLDRLMGSVRSLAELATLGEAAAARRIDAACRSVPTRCTRCGGERLYVLGGDRRRCASCRLTLRPITGRWLARLHASPRTWLSVARCFALGLGGKEVADVCGLSQPTAYRALETIRLALAWRDPAWRSVVEAFLARRPALELFKVCRQGESVNVVPLAARETEVVPTVLHKNGFVYADGGGVPGALVCHGGVNVPWNIGSDRTDLSHRDPFLIFILNRMPGHFGVRRAAFPLYLKELEFRYNNRGRPVDDLEGEVLAALAEYSPSANRGPQGAPL